ncbi:MAG TPA: tetratricopeptide repeat protein [Terriglobales bacterium]|nr:tetratricopeptide repeat protein [Terriglobales bacterium]
MQLRRIAFFLVTVLPLSLGAAQGLPSQSQTSEQVAVTPPAQHQVEPPASNASAVDLEKRGDELRANKYYLDAVDYYRAALAKKPDDPQILNKLGIAELLLTRYKEARKSFEHAIKHEHDYADARNNLGVIYYIEKKYPKAIKEYERAITLRPDAASFYSNLGAAYFSKKEFEKAVAAYSKALQLDPDVFERTSHSGVAAQMAKPEDRAHYDYVLAKLYAQSGATDRSLEYLRKAMEDGYKGIDNVYKDAEFTNLRKDPRFAALMAAKPPAIPD